MKKLSYISDHLISLLRSHGFNRSEQKWYYFLHIPKTAGTTFRFMLYDYFEQAEIYPNYYELTVKQRSKYYGWKDFNKQKDQLFHNGKRLLIGHFGWAVMRHFTAHKPNTLTFLRDPVKRVKSAIIYLRKKDRMYAGMSIDEVVDTYLVREGSLQARQLGYRPKRGIEEALKNLESIDFIGISEQFDKSLALCNLTFDWDLKAIPKKNVGSYKEEQFTPEQIEKIKASCEIDNIIYNRGVEFFNERCAKHGI